jgi:hypothetical protein
VFLGITVTEAGTDWFGTFMEKNPLLRKPEGHTTARFAARCWFLNIYYELVAES